MDGLAVDPGQIASFVDSLFRYASPGQTVALRSFVENETKPFRIEAVPLDTGSHRALVDAAIRQAQAAADCPKPVVFCPPIAGFISQDEPWRAREQDLNEAFALSVECDSAPGRAQETLEGLLGPATLVVASGGECINSDTGELEPKLHLHWRLSEPASGDQLAELKEARRLATALVGGDPSNVPAVHPIRWPGSWHRKGEPRLCRTVGLQDEQELDLLDALDRLRDAAPKSEPEAIRSAVEPPRSAPNRGDRHTAELIANITSGREYHPSLVPLAARLLGSGMYPGAVIEFLRGLMNTVPGSGRDLRWMARYNAIPQIVDSAKAKWGAREPAGEYPLRVIAASDFAGSPVPVRSWHVADLIPTRTVTMLGGDGGTGKSLLALQLAVATAVGTNWIGLPVRSGRAVYLSAEDDEEELHRRLADIAAADGIGLDSLGQLQIAPLAGEDAVLAAPEGKQNLVRPTALWLRVDKWLGEVAPALLVLDNLADVFAGEENSRAQARQFVGLLRGAAIRHNTSILVLSHPSLTGMSSGSGSSGSTAWSNSVRSRLYLSRLMSDGGTEVDPDLRVLASKKANYGRAGTEIRIRWEGGVFRLELEPRTAGDGVRSGEKRADRVFLDLLDRYSAEGRHVSATPSANYAPSVFAKDARAKGTTRSALAASMNRHFENELITVREFGPPSRRLKQIVRAECSPRQLPSESRRTPRL